MSINNWSELHTGGTLAFRTQEPTVPAKRLLVLLHGVGGSETNLAPFGDAVPADTRVVLAQGPLPLAAGQYAWFQVAFGAQGPRPDLAAAERSRLQLAQFIAELEDEYGLPAARTVVAGFSQGGIMSASIGLTQPQLVAGFAVLSGRILPEIKPQLASREALAGIKAFISHGQADNTLPVEWAQRSDAWLTELGIAHETRLFPGGHGISAPMQQSFVAWFEALTGA